MHHPPPTSFLLSLLTLVALSPAVTVGAGGRPKDAVLLSEVKSLTLTYPHKTTSRRVAAIPQLRCANRKPTAALCRLPHAQIATMRCVNQGASYTAQDIDSPDDAYVLKGSCGVEYTLALTEEGERRFPHLAKNTKKGGGLGGGEEGTDWSGVLFGVLFFAVLAWIVWSACVRAGENRRPRAPRRRGGNGWGGGGGGWWPGGGGGGGGGGPGRWDDPPPPYPGTKPAEETAGWRPGFWSGLASGAAAGYMAGNRGQRGARNTDYNYGRGGGLWGDRAGDSWGSGSGSWGRSSSPGGSSSSARYESTGYGSTSRR
ncbi:hypothetical protein MFIFM68171_10438 [Madurella fahalii]|uniref:Store-operated calcium entry-associated regulatory factor n=1 Tax=Madurella fahalii TaxID=1157608 RepID=A0ABQ0GR69_9PEZI